MNDIKTFSDLWAFMCKSDNALSFIQYYTTNPNETARAFWIGVLSTLELTGKITHDRALLLWAEITRPC